LGALSGSHAQLLGLFPGSLDPFNAIPNRHGLIEFACLGIGFLQPSQVRNKFVSLGMDLGVGLLLDRFRFRFKLTDSFGGSRSRVELSSVQQGRSSDRGPVQKFSP
jgi:hypothetical protein